MHYYTSGMHCIISSFAICIGLCYFAVRICTNIIYISKHVCMITSIMHEVHLFLTATSTVIHVCFRHGDKSTQYSCSFKVTQNYYIQNFLHHGMCRLYGKFRISLLEYYICILYSSTGTCSAIAAYSTFHHFCLWNEDTHTNGLPFALSLLL